MYEFQSKKIELSSHGIPLRGEMCYPGGSGTPLVVLCHGVPLGPKNPDDPGYPGLCRKFCGRGLASLFVNFRGTGESGGNFHLGGWFKDLIGIMDFVRDELSDRHPRVYLVGFSLGGCLTLKYAALHRNLSGVAALAAPARFGMLFERDDVDSFVDLARETGIIKDPDFPPSIDWFFEEMLEFDAVDFVGDVSPIPLLLVYATEDQVVPPEHARMLAGAAGETCQLRLLSGGEHRLRRDPRAFECMVEWMEGLKLKAD